MNNNYTIVPSIVRGAIVLIVSLLAWWIIPSSIIAPDVLVVCGVLLGFFVTGPFILVLALLLQVALMNFSPFFSWEWIYIIGVGIGVFVIMRLFIFKRTIFVVGIITAFAETLFWVIFGGLGLVVSVAFIEVLIYSILWAEIVYTVVIWLEKKYL